MIRNLGKKCFKTFLRSKGYRITKYTNIDLTPSPLSNYDIYKYFWEMTRDVTGDVADIGFGYGHSASIFSFLRKTQKDPESARDIYFFDSFKGFPEPSQFDRSPRNPIYGDFNHRTKREAQRQISDFISENISDRFFIEGYIEETVPIFPNLQFSLINLDTDMYDSHRVVLENFYPKLKSGGIIIFDDYKSTNWPGATLAIENYFGDSIKQIKSYKGRQYITKL
jgi:O-methyltransferase